jgi:uracil-DNA glycosylase
VSPDAGPVPPGSGWPADPAGPGTPVAHDAREVTELAASSGTLAELTARQSVCRACPRLVAWREQLTVQRRKSFRNERYWGRPIPGWGADRPRVLIVGLAPAAHGGNRTGRIFTGDRSGDFLYAALYRCGLAVRPESVTAGDGQRLIGARLVAAVRCAPPDNKPTPRERLSCEPWLATELAMVTGSLRAIVCLGGFAWQALWPPLREAGFAVPRPRPAFGHGTEVPLARTGSAEPPVLLLGCYHPSQQNTFTGRVTPAMLDAVLTRATAHAK